MIESYAYGMWPLVIINAAIFIIFVFSFLKPKKRWEWRSMGGFTAFVIALFTEMYGFPLTVYILTSILGNRYPATNPFSHVSGNLLAVFFGGSKFISGLFMFLGGAIMFVGLTIMGKAWKLIYKASGELVTSGIYDRVRHPQYFSLFLVTIGMMVQWPTILTVIMWPILMFMYYRLARREEKEMEDRFGAKYLDYRRNVPMFIPRLAQHLR